MFALWSGFEHGIALTVIQLWRKAMSIEHIRTSVESAIGFLTENPEFGRMTDSVAVAKLEKGLKVSITGDKGESATTDMPESIGGTASATSPGWYMRAALAACDTTMIAVKAAMENVELTELEVSIVSDSDVCGLFGIDGSTTAGPLEIRTNVRIGAKNASEEKLNEIVKWAETHSPVANALCKPLPLKTMVEIV